jgi:hypothetical protein
MTTATTKAVRNIGLCLILFIFSLTTANAQDKTGTIKGTIKDRKGKSLAGATVSVDGTKLISVSSADGVFIVKSVPEGNQTLLISFIGFETTRQSVTVKANEETSAEININESLPSWFSRQNSAFLVTNFSALLIAKNCVLVITDYSQAAVVRSYFCLVSLLHRFQLFINNPGNVCIKLHLH